MIVRFFKTGQSRGEAPVHYLLRLRDHKGELRPEQPDVLEGNANLTISLINSISRKHKYASGCLAFRANEQPTRQEIYNIIDRFKAVVSQGLKEDQFNTLFVLHREPPDPKSGACGFHIHFVMPMTILSGQTPSGKELTGRRWNPHPPGKQTIETMEFFAKIINHDHGWEQVKEKATRVGVDSFWRKNKDCSNLEKAELLRKEINRAIRSGLINSRDEVCSYLDQTLGLTVTRTGGTYVSVKFPGSSKAIRLKGAMFEDQTDFATLRGTKSHDTGTESLSVPEYQQTKTRMADLLAARNKTMAGHVPALGIRKITTKEKRNGTREKPMGGNHLSNSKHEWSTALPVTASSLERNVFPASARQWSHSDDGHAEKGHGRSQEAYGPSQHSGRSNSGNAGPRGIFIGGNAPKAQGQTINEQIRQLSIQLLECEPWSAQAAAIANSINALVGQREQLPKGKKFRR